jgi:SM-20-related protein
MASASIAPHFESHLAHAAAALHDHGWAVVEDFVDARFARALRSEAAALRGARRFRPAGVGRGAHWRLDPRLRRDEVCWIDPTDPMPCQGQLLEVLEQLRLQLNQRLTLGLFEYEAHLAVYPRGAFYLRHRDHFKGTEDRRVTTTLYLNEPWSVDDGGQIRLFLPGADPLEILPRAGTLVSFLSQELDHEVLPARRDRWSWTGWYKQRPR